VLEGHLFLELRDVGSGQLAVALSIVPVPVAQPLLRARLDLVCAAGAIRAEIPAGLHRTAAVRAAAADTLAALRAGIEVDPDRGAATRAERAHLPDFGDDAQQLFRRGDAALHRGEPVFAERDHAAGHRRLAQLIFRRLHRDQAAQLVGQAPHFIDADPAAVARVV